LFDLFDIAVKNPCPPHRQSSIDTRRLTTQHRKTYSTYSTWRLKTHARLIANLPQTNAALSPIAAKLIRHSGKKIFSGCPERNIMQNSLILRISCY
jgi:hypothetical protein